MKEVNLEVKFNLLDYTVPEYKFNF